MNDMNEILVKNETAKFQNENREQKIERIDFKMVTFSLGGKDYGIDIMKVKEIAKFGGYTYVPNSAPYVRGVYNLRGDIISIIDLRVMFHLSVEKRREGFDSGLILRLEENVLGMIVDSIDKVVGISSEEIQPPHPLFGDINIKYISGVVESNGRLYIILDVEKIFAKPDTVQKKEIHVNPVQETEAPVASTSKDYSGQGEPDKDFIIETLTTFKDFYVSPINTEWIDKRFVEWKAIRGKKGADLQLKSTEEAEEFLENFYSPYTESFWGEDVEKALLEILPDLPGKMINVWNPGCGKGFETYSIAAIVSKRFPDKRIKVWANDNDLLSISTAPNLVFTDDDVPPYLVEYTVKGKNGLSFNSTFKEKILFEYHDVLHKSSLPEIDIVVARDLISFLNPEDQRKLFEEIYEKTKPTGFLILGMNERPMDETQWERIEKNHFSVFRKITS